MFFWRLGGKPHGPIYDWLTAHKDEIRDGTADFRGTRVDETTQLHQYDYVISLGTITLTFKSPHFLPTEENGHLRQTGWKYGLISAVCGWWCFPWGPLFTIPAIVANLAGGRRRSAASLIQLIEWGWDAPNDVSVTAHEKDLIELSDEAATEIRSRIAQGEFPDGIAVRITPTKWADGEVEISFDYPVSDGRDWVDRSQGLLLLIDKKHETQLQRCRVDFADGTFSATQQPVTSTSR